MLKAGLGNKSLNTLYLLTLGTFLASCNAGPDYVRPLAEVPQTYKESSFKTWKVATPGEECDRGRWWLAFQDDILNDLEEQATLTNQSIAAAQAQYDQALALIDKAEAGFFPVISASLGDTKSRTQSLSSPSSPLTKPYNTGSMGLQAEWEIDLWGNIRRQVEAQEAALQANAAQLAAMRLSIQATLAQAYFQLRAVDETQDMYDESILAYEKFLRLTKNQYAAGTVSQLPLLQADAQLQAIKVLAIDTGISRAQLEHAIAVLTNNVPANFTLVPQKTRLIPPEVPLTIPSVLLERRPDIANAERLMAEANAQIGVATSAFFPVLTLSGSRTHNKKSLGQLFSAPAVVWSIGAQLTETLFDGGARQATVEAAGAAYQVTVANYRQTVLAAFQDVEDNFVALRILEQEQKVQKQALATAEKQLAYTLNGYKAGIASSLDVQNALFNVYTAKRNIIAIASRQMTSVVGLIKSFG
jgi:NodT family efflux transporter outer membrane factor (OMF) lipoprotein